jgi:hypothetical protein
VIALAVGVAGLLVFGVVGFVTYQSFQKGKAAEEEKARSEERAAKQARAKALAEAKAAATPPKTAEPAPTPPPGSAPAPTQVVQQSKGASTPPAAVKSAVPTPPVQDQPAVADAPEKVEPSAQFKTWVNGLKISGVRAGAAPRMMTGGLTFNLGDVVNADLGITFDAYDAERHILRFKDKTGATVERRDR